MWLKRLVPAPFGQSHGSASLGIALGSRCLQLLSPAAVPSALLQSAGPCREAMEERKVSNLD